MSLYTRRRGAGLALGSLLLLAACGGDIEEAPTGGGADGDEAAECAGLQMAVNPWVGYEASAYVVGAVAEQQLGCQVEYVELKEDLTWPEFGTGQVDVIIEDWGHPESEELYFEQTGDGTAMDFGPNGNEGIIGWYVPPWMAEEYPDITDWENLNEYADLFQTSESGDQGQFLGSDPSYVQFDEAIIENLDLDFEVVFSGSEAASITAFRQAEENRTPLIGYFYAPQWFLAEVPLVKVALPEYEDGCQEPQDQTDCDYPVTELKKIVSTSWVDEGGPAVDLVQNFSWTNDDQSAVALMIADEGMSAEDAAAQWIEDNPDTVDAWLG